MKGDEDKGEPAVSSGDRSCIDRDIPRARPPLVQAHVEILLNVGLEGSQAGVDERSQPDRGD